MKGLNNMRSTETNKIPYIKIALCCLVAVLLICVGFRFLKEWEGNMGLFPEHEISDEVIKHDGVEYVLKENVETFLVLGLDKFEGSSSTDSYNNDKQADFLMLFVFDNDSKQYTAIHINRDTVVEINVLGVAGNKVGTVYKQIALSHTYGNGKDLSCHNTANSVSSLLMGMKVNHYASVTLDSVAIVNDLVGGVRVEILDDFTGIDDSLVKGETVILKGTQALTYVQTRKGLEDSSNSTRMQRQQQYINALYEAFNECAKADDEFIVDVSLKMSDYMISNRSVTQLQALAEKFSEYEFLGIESLAGESVLGEEYMEFYPDEEAIKEMMIKLFYMPKA